jgi:hypothetical protein
VRGLEASVFFFFFFFITQNKEPENTKPRKRERERNSPFSSFRDSNKALQKKNIPKNIKEFYNPSASLVLATVSPFTSKASDFTISSSRLCSSEDFSVSRCCCFFSGFATIKPLPVSAPFSSLLYPTTASCRSWVVRLSWSE